MNNIMKHKIIRLKDKLFIPTCIVLILYCLFNAELISLPFINWIRIVILLLLAFLSIGILFELLNKKKQKNKKQLFKTKSLIDFLYLYSEYIVSYMFYFYFFFYLVLMLDRKSILYNYLLLLIFGMFLGYRLAVKTYYYLKQRENIDK